MSNTFEQNERTKKFIQAVKTLVSSGKEDSFKEIATKLDWHPNAMSLVINGYRNVPREIERKFEALYKNPTPIQNHTKTLQAAGTDYKDAYIELLQQQLKEKERRLQALEEKVANYLNSNKLEAYLQTLLALSNTQLDVLTEHRSVIEQKPLKAMKKVTDTLYDGYQRQYLDTGTLKGGGTGHKSKES